MDGDSWRGGERDGRWEKGEGGEVGMEMERDGASQHDRMTDGLSDEQGGKEEGQADIEHAAITDVRFRCVCMCTNLVGFKTRPNCGS